MTTDLPQRLRDFKQYLASQGRTDFGDWELTRAAPLSTLFPPEEAGLVVELESRFFVFAGDFSGGLLALHMASDTTSHQATVVSFSSEGSYDVLGASFDDFLALVASDHPSEFEDCWVLDDDQRQWVVASGVIPYNSADRRLAELSSQTRAFRSDFANELRSVSRRHRPLEVLDHALVLGQRLGDIALGMPRVELDQRWGNPETPGWAAHDNLIGANYERLPFWVEFDAETDTVVRVILHGGIHRAITPDGTDPMFMSVANVSAWLNGLGFEVEKVRDELRVPEAHLRFTTTSSPGIRGERWVEAITLTAL